MQRDRGPDSMPGDELLPAAPVVMDREALLAAQPEQVWPWLVQLGKGRGGWYLPRGLEHLIPRGHRALRTIAPAHQDITVGDRVPDYGPGGWFEARIVDPPHALVWWSERGRGIAMSWTLVLEPVGTEDTRLRIRLRINRHLGRRAPALVEGIAELFDLVTIRLMIAGLRERLAGAPESVRAGY